MEIIVLLLIWLPTAILAVGTVVPFLPQASGLVRVCDFPRVQITALAAGLAVLTALFVTDTGKYVLLVVQIAIVAVQSAIWLRYTPLWPVQTRAVDKETRDAPSARFLSCNVKMSNRDYDRLLSLIAELEPEVILLLEVDQAWMQGLRSVRDKYPHRVEHPLDNSYGMALWSKLELDGSEVRFLLLPEVPSIRTTIVLGDGRRFRLHMLHPEPPAPFADTLGRDGELILTARAVNDDPLPSIVAGDLNDVAWSRTTRRFQRLSCLLDPRVGRGFYNSFDARNPFLRWPLDHLFHSSDFRLVELERLRAIGSDHFPMLFALALTGGGDAENEPEEPDGEDIREAKDVASDARQLDRTPIGTDWEK